MELKQKERESMILVHNTRVGKVTRRSWAGILSSKATREHFCSSLLWQQRNLRIHNHPGHSSKGAELAVLKAAPVIVSHSDKAHLFECITIFMTWKAPARIRGLGCHSVNHSVSCILPFFIDFLLQVLFLGSSRINSDSNTALKSWIIHFSVFYFSFNTQTFIFSKIRDFIIQSLFFPMKFIYIFIWLFFPLY